MTPPRDAVDALLEEIITLPSLPDVVQRVLELLDDPAATLTDIGRVVSTDPSIALKTLRLVNSAYYGLRNKVTAVETAVSLLGAKVIKNLVITATVFESFTKTTTLLLQHSVATGIAMGTIASLRRSPVPLDPSEAFVFGLLHDIGKIILDEFMPEEWKRADELSQTKNIPICEAEREIIGVDHAEIGARLAMKWKLADTLIAAISAHHNLTACRRPDLAPYAATLAAADYLVIAAGFGARPSSIAKVAPATWAKANLANADIPHMLDAFLDALSGMDELMQAVSGA